MSGQHERGRRQSIPFLGAGCSYLQETALVTMAVITMTVVLAMIPMTVMMVLAMIPVTVIISGCRLMIFLGRRETSLNLISVCRPLLMRQ